jgi:hypothetical protein
MSWARHGGGDWDDSSSSSSSGSGSIRVRHIPRAPFFRTSAATSCTSRSGFTFTTWVSAVSEPLFVAQMLHGAMNAGAHSAAFPTALMTALELNQRMLTLPAMPMAVRAGDCGTCLPGCSSCTGFLRCTACTAGHTQTPLLSLITPPTSGEPPRVLEQLLSGLDVCLPTATALRIAAERATAASPAVTAMSGPPTPSHPTAPAPAPAPGLHLEPVAAGVTLPGPHGAAEHGETPSMRVGPAPEPMPAPVPLSTAPTPTLNMQPAYLGRNPSPLRLESNAARTSPPLSPPVLITVAAAAPAPPHGVIEQPTVIALAVTVGALLLLLCIGMARRAARSRVIFVVKAADDALERGLETPHVPHRNGCILA